MEWAFLANTLVFQSEREKNKLYSLSSSPKTALLLPEHNLHPPINNVEAHQKPGAVAEFLLSTRVFTKTACIKLV